MPADLREGFLWRHSLLACEVRSNSKFGLSIFEACSRLLSVELINDPDSEFFGRLVILMFFLHGWSKMIVVCLGR